MSEKQYEIASNGSIEYLQGYPSISAVTLY